MRNLLVLSARDRRSVFTVPRGDVVYVGTTDTSYVGAPAERAEPAVDRDDVEYLLEPLGRTLDVAPLDAGDVVAAWAGLRPLVAAPPGAPSAPPSELSRKDEVWIGEAGMITVAGGKLTGFRKMAETVLGHVGTALGTDLGAAPPPSPLPGGDLSADLSAEAARLARHHGVTTSVAERLVRLYGSESAEVIGLGAEPLTPGGSMITGEVPWAVTVEAAGTLADVIDRRSRAAAFLPGERAGLVAPVALEMAGCLGWDDQASRRRGGPGATAVRRRAGVRHGIVVTADPDDAAVAELVGRLGDQVTTDPAELGRLRRDQWARSELQEWLDARSPTAAARRRRADLHRAMAEAVGVCRRHGVGMVPRGAGSGVVGGVLAGPGSVVLSTAAMVGVRHLSAGDLLASYGAGTNGLDAETEAQRHGCTIGHWPQSIDRSSVGGWVATRASGQYSTAYGNIEDLVHGLVAVLPDGSVFESRPTPRAAAGPDLRHLLIGSEGCLGVVTEVTFSLRRRPGPGVRQAFHFVDFAAGVAAAASVVTSGWRPAVVRLYDRRESQRHFKGTFPKGRCILVFLHEGPPGAAPLEAAAVAAACREAGGERADPEAVDRWFEHRNEVPTWTSLFEQGLVADTIEVATAWSGLATLYDEITGALQAVRGVVAATAHSSHAYRSGANLYVTFAAAADRDGMLATYDACWEAAMAAASRLGAGLAHHHGIGRVRRPWLHEELGRWRPGGAAGREAGPRSRRPVQPGSAGARARRRRTRRRRR